MVLPNNLKLPDSWQDVTVEQFIELKTINSEDFSSLLAVKLEQLAILTDTSIDDECWEDVDSDMLFKILDEMKWLNTEPKKDIKYELKLIGLNIFFKKFELMTLGEFIDLEHYFNADVLQNLPRICSILYRKTQFNHWGHLEFEPRGYDEVNRAELFLDRSINDVFGIITHYVSYKTSFLETYRNLFDEEDEEIEEIPKEEDVEFLSSEERKAIEFEKRVKKWNWERLIYKMSNGDMTKFDEVTELSLIFFFNQLGMRSDLDL